MFEDPHQVIFTVVRERFGINQPHNRDKPLFPLVPEEIVVGASRDQPGRAQVVYADERGFWVLAQGELHSLLLAIDRQNREVAYLYKPLHLSVLRMIQYVVTAARGANIPVAICGEMGGDPIYALVLMALGFDELSMTAGQIPAVKQIIRRSSRTEAAALLEQAMSLTTAEEIERYIRTEMERPFSMDGE